eukprot:2072943-Amphidinium_carterae.1
MYALALGLSSTRERPENACISTAPIQDVPCQRTYVSKDIKPDMSHGLEVQQHSCRWFLIPTALSKG